MWPQTQCDTFGGIIEKSLKQNNNRGNALNRRNNKKKTQHKEGKQPRECRNREKNGIKRIDRKDSISKTEFYSIRLAYG